MRILTFQVNNSSNHIPGIKEALEMFMENWGDVKMLEVREMPAVAMGQTRFISV